MIRCSKSTLRMEGSAGNLQGENTVDTTIISSLPHKAHKDLRERDRLRARYHIRERVHVESHRTDATDEVLPQVLVPEDARMFIKYMTYVKAGDRSKFSLSNLDNHFQLLSCLAPIHLLQEHDSEIFPHSFQLCKTWFGPSYASFLESYVESMETLTLMEYAAWMGKYSIVGALLLGGVNPCTRCQLQGEKMAIQGVWPHEIGSKVLRRFFDCFPLPLSTYTVKRVIDSRINAYRLLSTKPGAEKLCQICRSEISINDTLCFDQCNHVLCEECLWKDFLTNVDDRGELADVFVCPVCIEDSSKIETPSATSLARSYLCHDKTPSASRICSITRFKALPRDRQSLISSSKKKKKQSEKEHLASSWSNAVAPSLGSTQSVRREKFFTFVNQCAVHYLRACIQSGVDVNWTNEYGQTALYISAMNDSLDAVCLLLDNGADSMIAENGGSIPLQVAIAKGHSAIAHKLAAHCKATAPNHLVCPEEFPFQSFNNCTPRVKELVGSTMDHPGAGSFIVDDALTTEQLRWLLSLHCRLPVDLSQKQKSGLCSERSYFCDAEERVTRALEATIRKCSTAFQSVKVLKHMRFLNYTIDGTALNPHVDICRVDHESGDRSTHTLILYVTTCQEGGETCLLKGIAGDARNNLLATVSPKCGRLLLFPHDCPHEGKAVKSVPKILLRGEAVLMH